jgi:hypothetical protein
MMHDEVTWTRRTHAGDPYTEIRSDYFEERDRQKYLDVVAEYYWNII